MKFIFTIGFMILWFPGFSQPDTINLSTTFKKEAYLIQYPSSWTIDTSKMLGTEFFIFSVKENSDDKFKENVNLLIQDLNGMNLNLEEYAQLSEKQIPELATEGEVLESKKMKTDKTEYHIIIYKMTQNAFKLKIEQYYFVKDSKAYVLTFTSEADKFDQYKNIAEKILSSFYLK